MTRFSTVQKDLFRLSSFGLNISDAHSCLILLPPQFLNTQGDPGDSSKLRAEPFLEIGGYTSLCEDIVEHAKIYTDSGLIGWVAKHNRAIHVSPFEHDSRTLGVYGSDQKLKSFLGLPISLEAVSGDGAGTAVGVLAVDSKKSFAFSKLQAKLLEDLCREIANVLELRQVASVAQKKDPTWDEFLERACALGHSLGALSLEIMRIHPRDFESLERNVGTMRAIELTKQAQRLILQTLPPLYPALTLPNGDIIVAIDTMMSALTENKVKALLEHLHSNTGTLLEYEFIKNPLRKRKERSVNLETLVVETAPRTLTRINGEERQQYEYRRA